MSTRYLALLMSLRNLARRRGGVAGQVATVMLLMIGGALIATLALSSLGRVTTMANNASNVADSAALLLASQLASKSNYLWDALKEPPGDGQGTMKQCKKGGFLTIILIVVIAIILIIITIFTFGAASPLWAAVIPALTAIGATVGVSAMAVAVAIAGAIGGMIGGIIGGAITGGAKGALMGAIQGFAIGLALGMMAGAAVAAPTAGGVGATAGTGSVAGPGGATVVTPAAAGTPAGTSTAGASGTVVEVGAGSMIPADAAIISGSAISLPTVGVGALTAGAALYNGYVADQIAADAMAAAAKALNGLSEKIRIRETVFFHAFSQTVDDPNMTAYDGPPSAEYPPEDSRRRSLCFFPNPVLVKGDPTDSDGDGDINESIPCFQYWWDMRVRTLKQNKMRNLRVSPNTRVRNFVNGPLDQFDDKATALHGKVKRNNTRRIGLLARQEIEGADGMLLKIVRRLWSTDPKYRVSFWKPGPSKIQMARWEGRTDCDGTEALSCPGNPAPPGLDDVDAMIAELETFSDYREALRRQPTDVLVVTLEDWLPWYYDPDTKDSYYDTLRDAQENGKVIGTASRLTAWYNELRYIRNKMPVCQFKMQNGRRVGILNPPCRYGANFTSIDGDMQNEYRQLQNRIRAFVNAINQFTAASRDLHHDLMGVQENVQAQWGANNPARYQWRILNGSKQIPEDRQQFMNNIDDFTVYKNIIVRVSDFKVPRMKAKKSFMKSCMKLADYEDNGSNTWVRITENEPNPSDEEGNVWKLNLGLNTAVSKRSSAAFSYNYVRLQSAQ